jgi:beta-N-acetylhexosaminidase
MRNRYCFLFCLFVVTALQLNAQHFYANDKPARRWVDSVYKSLSKEERIAQLMVVRAHSNLGKEHVEELTQIIQKYNVGGLCFFQGGPIREAVLTNYYQQIAKTPLMVCIDGEWGLGMRLDSVVNFSRQMMLGAMQDSNIVYAFGKAVAKQCKRLGIQVNYAPVADINNNPDNPVINDRSFGENKYKVASFATAYMRGLQDENVMACAKHFPGHGDVAVDSHLDLPVINKTRAQLDSLELYPFRRIIKEGVASVMNAHLYIPSIDTTANRATSLSYNNVTGLLKNELGFKGIAVTDGLEMKGITKFYPSGDASVQSLIAGNDMLCLPGDIEGSIQKTMIALKKRLIKKKEFKARVKKILLAKYNLHLNHFEPIDTNHLVEDINKNTADINTLIANNAITLVKQETAGILPVIANDKVAYIAIGINAENAIIKYLQTKISLDAFYIATTTDSIHTYQLIDSISKLGYTKIITGLHHYSRRPANNFSLSAGNLYAMHLLAQKANIIMVTFGNPYCIKNYSNAANIIACYEDDDITQNVAGQLLLGYIKPKGTLPVSVNDTLKAGTGIVAEELHASTKPINTIVIDSIVQKGLSEKAFPGCTVTAIHKGNIVLQKNYGYTDYEQQIPVSNNQLYDVASITKVAATTLAIMKLYDEKKIKMDDSLAVYLPGSRNTDIGGLTIRNLMIHQAGLVSFIPFYKEITDTIKGKVNPTYFRKDYSKEFSIPVAEQLYLRTDWNDTILQRIMSSPLVNKGKYVYSDNDFILLGKVVESITHQSLEEYVLQQFYLPMQLNNIGYHPLDKFYAENIVPSEKDNWFRKQVLQGNVNDEGAAMMGGAAGHAGLFSSADNLAILFQMLLNNGAWNGRQYIEPTTVGYFTGYHSKKSRRGLGFDKPELHHTEGTDYYPAASAASSAFGHTGFTGTCVWADPEHQLVYVFLSNRTYPDRKNTTLNKLNIRGEILEAVYKEIQKIR